MTIQRTELFVPLTTGVPAGEGREFRITVIPRAERGEFKDLGENDGQSRPKPSDVVPSASTGQGGVTVHQQGGNGKYFPGKKNCEPQVLLQRDGDRITSIRIQCSCGQVMDLACDYGELPPAKTA
jgi:hypothetical protein